MNYGDFPIEETIHMLFTTRAFATGIPGTLSAATVAVYEDITATPIETSVAVTESLNSIAGLNAVPIVAIAASGYEVGKNYHVVIEAGTVGGVSVVGEVIGYFSIGRSAAAVDLANVTDGLSALKTLLDAIPTTAMRGTDSAALASVCTEGRLAELDAGNLPTDIAAIPTTAMRGTDSALLASTFTTMFAGITAIGEWLGIIAGKQAGNATALTEMKATGAGFGTVDPTTDSLEALRDRGDAAWTTGGGGSILDILNVQPVIPTSIDLANTATVRIGLMLTNALDDLPSTAEITPGTVSIERKSIGGTSWSAIVTDGAMSEQAGLVYFDEVFDSGTGYAEGDSIRVTFKSTKITVSANDFEVTDSNGVMFQTSIREAMRGTNSAALASVATEGRLAELDAGNLPTDIAAIPTTAMRGTDSAALASVATEARLAELDAANLPTTTDDTLIDTAVIGALGAGLTDLGGMSTGMKAEVNAEVDTALATTTYAEPGQGTPAATASIKDKIGYLFKAWRNRSNQTATTYQLFNDDATTVDHKATVSDDATTAEKGEVATGP